MKKLKNILQTTSKKSLKIQNQNPLIEGGVTIQWPNEKGPTRQTTIYKTLYRKRKIDQHKPH